MRKMFVAKARRLLLLTVTSQLLPSSAFAAEERLAALEKQHDVFVDMLSGKAEILDSFSKRVQKAEETVSGFADRQAEQEVST